MIEKYTICLAYIKKIKTKRQNSMELRITIEQKCLLPFIIKILETALSF